MTAGLPVLVAGGGIGGLAAALALSRQGLAVKVLEQAPEIGEIGAGIQLGPDAFAAFRLVRNELWKGRTPERFYDAIEWLYGWRLDNCLAA